MLLNDLKHAPVVQLTPKTNEFMERLFQHDKQKQEWKCEYIVKLRKWAETCNFADKMIIYRILHCIWDVNI